jgi:transcription elongation factor Elf1
MNINNENTSISKYLKNYTCPNCGNDDYLRIDVTFNGGHPKWNSDFIVNCKKCDHNYGLKIQNEIQSLETDYDILKKSKKKYFEGRKNIEKRNEIKIIQRNINEILIFLHEIQLEIDDYNKDKESDDFDPGSMKSRDFARHIESQFTLSIAERENKILEKIKNLQNRYLPENNHNADRDINKNWLVNFLEKKINFKSFFNLLNIFIFFSICFSIFFLFINKVTIIDISFDLNKIYKGNLSNYKYLYLNYYPALSISLTLFLIYRFLINFSFNSLKLSIFSKDYYDFIFIKWKVITFILSVIFLFLLTTIELVDYGYLTINRFGSTFLITMSFLTFFTAPWVVGNLIRYFFSLNSNLRVNFPFISLLMLFFVSCWFYDFYFLLFKEGTYPKTWFYNMTRSVPIYITAGLFWNLTYNSKLKKIKFAFLTKKEVWFSKKDTYFYKTNINFFVFTTKFLPYSLPILLIFFFFIFNSVNFYKVLDFTEIILKDGKKITQININFNRHLNEKFIDTDIILNSNIVKKDTLINENINLFFGDYYALVIGINDYDLSLGKLDTPINDANVISSLLEKKYNFNVKKLVDPSRKDIIQSIEWYRKNLSFTDNLLIYYAGHGELDEDGDEGYWQPIDANLDSQTNWISNSWIKTQLKAIKAKHIILIADSCFAAAIFKGNNEKKDSKVSDSEYIKKISDKITRKALTAGGLEPVLDGGGGGHSVFANALIKILKQNDKPLIGSSLYTEISKHLAHNAAQTPTYEVIDKTGHVMGGDFVFIPQSN